MQRFQILIFLILLFSAAVDGRNKSVRGEPNYEFEAVAPARIPAQKSDKLMVFEK